MYDSTKAFSQKAFLPPKEFKSLFEATANNPELAKKMQHMKEQFEQVKAEPTKYNLKTVEIKEKDIEKTEKVMRSSWRHSHY